MTQPPWGNQPQPWGHRPPPPPQRPDPSRPYVAWVVGRRVHFGRTGLILLAAGAVLGILLCAGTSILDSDNPGDDASDFFRAVAAEHYTTAHSRLCDATRARFTPEQFTAFVQAQPALAGSGHWARNTDHPDRVQMSLYLADGSTATRWVPMQRLGFGKYRVCGDPY